MAMIMTGEVRLPQPEKMWAMLNDRVMLELGGTHDQIA